MSTTLVGELTKRYAYRECTGFTDTVIIEFWMNHRIYQNIVCQVWLPITIFKSEYTSEISVIVNEVIHLSSVSQGYVEGVISHELIVAQKQQNPGRSLGLLVTTL